MVLKNSDYLLINFSVTFQTKIRRHVLEYFRGQLNSIKSLKLRRADLSADMMGADRCIQKQRLKHAKNIYNVRAMNEIFYQLQQLGDANVSKHFGEVVSKNFFIIVPK